MLQHDCTLNDLKSAKHFAKVPPKSTMAGVVKEKLSAPIFTTTKMHSQLGNLLNGRVSKKVCITVFRYCEEFMGAAGRYKSELRAFSNHPSTDKFIRRENVAPYYPWTPLGQTAISVVVPGSSCKKAGNRKVHFAEARTFFLHLYYNYESRCFPYFSCRSNSFRHFRYACTVMPWKID